MVKECPSGMSSYTADHRGLGTEWNHRILSISPTGNRIVTEGKRETEMEMRAAPEHVRGTGRNVPENMALIRVIENLRL